MPRKDATAGGHISAQAQQDLVSEGIENFELPKSIVTKIAKSAIPENAKLQKETVLSLVKGSTVFINYLAATAHDVAQSKQHKSISASDVLKALELIEFGDLIEPLQSELQVYRELAKTDKSKKGSANLSNAQASASASGPPNTKKGGGAAVAGASSAAQQEQSASAAPKGPPKARIKNPKGTSASAPVPAGAPTDEDEVDMGDSVSAAGRSGARHDDSEGFDHADHGDEVGNELDEENDDAEERDEEHDAGGEEFVDMMQIEEEEVRKDARGIEEREEDES